MTDPYGDRGWPDQDPRPPKRISGSGVAIGAFLVPVAVIAVAVLSVSALGFMGPVGVVVVAFVAALIVLVTGKDPFRRGIAAGVLITLSVVMLLFGACFAILSSLEFG